MLLVKRLLDGAGPWHVSVYAPDGDGNAPLHLAAAAGSVRVLSELMKNWASVEAPNAVGLNAFAIVAGMSTAMQLALEHAVKESEKQRLLMKADPRRKARDREHYARLTEARRKAASAVQAEAEAHIAESAGFLSGIPGASAERCREMLAEVLKELKAEAAQSGGMLTASGRPGGPSPAPPAPSPALAGSSSQPAPLSAAAAEAHSRLDPRSLDSLPWEIDVTRNAITAWDRADAGLRFAAFRALQLLAEGRPEASRPVTPGAAGPLHLRLLPFGPDGGQSRILYEVAIAFSLRARGYVDVLRVWDIFIDLGAEKEPVGGHGDKCEQAVAAVLHARERGRSARGRQWLRVAPQPGGTAAGAGDNPSPRELPRTYEPWLLDSTSAEGAAEGLLVQFCPPAALDGGADSYALEKLYVLKPGLAAAVLRGNGAGVEVPFRITDEEAEVISATGSSKLILGRSGTGKVRNGRRAPCLPHPTPYYPDVRFTGLSLGPSVCTPSPMLALQITFLLVFRGPNATPHSLPPFTHFFWARPPSPQTTVLLFRMLASWLASCAQAGPDARLCQLLVTSNPLLHSEIRAYYRGLLSGCAFELGAGFKPHNGAEREAPHSLRQLAAADFPLFFSRRELLVALDGSVASPGDRPFFERLPDGTLHPRAAAYAWGREEDRSRQTTLEDLEELVDADSGQGDAPSEAREGAEGDPTAGRAGGRPRAPPVKGGRDVGVTRRFEVDFAKFVDHFWPHLVKGGASAARAQKHEGCHASVVWAEIISFIKGSAQALEEPRGHLSLPQYEALGHKRSPNFVGSRAAIYAMFEHYERLRKAEEGYDICDLVAHIYRRKRAAAGPGMLLLGGAGLAGVAVDELYIDEVQDFTGAQGARVRPHFCRVLTLPPRAHPSSPRPKK